MILRLFSKIVIKFGKWKVDPFPEIKKAVVLMAPHTSMWDFVYGRLYFATKNRKPAVLIKKEIFKWPLGSILKKLGGVPVDRDNSVAITKQVIKLFEKHDEFYLIITPEATRKKTKNWKKGFIKIARAADVPVIMSYLDCKNKIWGVKGILDMTGSDEEIMERLKKHYQGLTGVHPNRFETGYE